MDNLEWMMWRIDDTQLKDPPLANLIRAIQYFNEKYGVVPNRCETAPGWFDGQNPPTGMEMTESKNLRPDHFMLAMDPALKQRLPGKRS